MIVSETTIDFFVEDHEGKPLVNRRLSNHFRKELYSDTYERCQKKAKQINGRVIKRRTHITYKELENV